MSYFAKSMASPVGVLTLIASERGLSAVLWERSGPERLPRYESIHAPEHPTLLQAERELGEYFSGQRTVFDVPLDPHGTEFQRRVWKALMNIGYGETRSYGEIARQVGNPKASRAVGAANGSNPIAIITPCHRVIGADGSLTGFGGGVGIKQRLLALEARQCDAWRGSETLAEGRTQVVHTGQRNTHRSHTP